MSKFTYFIVFNIVVYVVYAIIDKFFILLSLYSNPELGESFSVMPTNTDMVLIFINVIVSSILGFYFSYKIKAMSEI